MSIDIVIKSLLDGMRSDGRSLVECCLAWGLTDSEYNGLKEGSKELQRADEIGSMHCAEWWHKCFRDLALKGNASALAFGMKNVVGWQDKPEIKETKEEQPITAIEISLMQPREEFEDDDES